jgi:hypothetical protein
MKNRLENLIKFDDFSDDWKSIKSNKTKRTETGADILNENLYSYNINVKKLIDIVESGELTGTDIIDRVVNDLRDSLLKMEQSNQISEDDVDELDEIHDGDWNSWILDVAKLVPEKTIINILEFLGEY